MGRFAKLIDTFKGMVAFSGYSHDRLYRRLNGNSHG